jgi:DNA-3-methyladenine glycosylase
MLSNNPLLPAGRDGRTPPVAGWGTPPGGGHFGSWNLAAVLGCFCPLMNFVPLPQSFYEPSAEVVAPRLLGQWLVRKTAKGFCGGPIVETEAYLVGDPASHGFAGESARNRVVFGPPGRAYVYFIYGVHYCVNAVCQPAGRAEAVLIRAVEAQFGEGLMFGNRPVASTISLTNGPGKLCAAMAIDRKLDGVDLCDSGSGLFIAANPKLKLFRKERGPILTTTRVGISRAAHLHLRFCLGGSAFISRHVRPLLPQSIAPPVSTNPARTKH